MDFSGKTALVSGASRGIGAAIADRLSAGGAYTIGTATTPEGATNITKRLANAAGGGAGIVLDISSTDSIAALARSLLDAAHTVDILINNAAITKDNLMVRMTDDDWERVIETNLNSIFRMTRCFLRGMIKAKAGRIINIGSVVGAAGNSGQTNYAATKAGLVGFTRALAQEVGVRNITVNAIAPGFIDTDMTRALTDKQKAALLQQIPLRRFGEVDDVAQAAVFLASAAAAYITGHTLHVNGGMYCG